MADQSLSEVRRKLAEATKAMDTLQGLVRLREARKDKAQRKGTGYGVGVLGQIATVFVGHGWHVHILPSDVMPVCMYLKSSTGEEIVP